MKKTLCFLTMLALLWSMLPFVPCAEEFSAPHVRIYQNGEEIEFPDALPQNVNGRIMVPFRAICEALGASVGYDEATGEVTATRGDTRLSFRNGEETLSLHNSEGSAFLTMDVLPYLDTETARTMVSVRFFSEAFGLSVTWNGQDVLLADFSALLDSFLAENPFFSAILLSRNPAPTPFLLYRTFDQSETVRHELPNQTISSYYRETGVGEHGALKDGFAMEGTESIQSFGYSDLPDGTYGAVPFHTLYLGNTTYQKLELYSLLADRGILYTQGRTLDVWWKESPPVSLSGETIAKKLAEDLLLTAKSIPECKKEILSLLTNENQSPEFYAHIRAELQGVTEACLAATVIAAPGTVELSFRAPLDTDETFTEVRLSTTFSNQGDVLAIRYDRVFQETFVSGSHRTLDVTQTATRIPGHPASLMPPENVMDETEWAEAVRTVTIR